MKKSDSRTIALRSAGTVDFGRPVVGIRVPRFGLSGLIDLRLFTVTLLLTIVALTVTVLALGIGDYPISPVRVLATLFGNGTRIETQVVNEWRMPRALMALVLGAALGASGAIFQSLTRNPLGSPDIIGFNVGAYTGALIVILLIGGTSYYAVSAGAIIGGVSTALAVYLLAFKRGVQGFRLIIVGIAVSASLTSVNTWLILKADLDEAMSAAVWGAGSLNGVVWPETTTVLVVLSIVVVLLCFCVKHLKVLEMGDDAAAALGVRPEPIRLALIVLGVSLTAIATAAVGPIAFVSLAAPQLARRLTRSAGVAVLPAAAMGAVLLTVSDVIAQAGLGSLPVGVVTVSIGGIYLVWLLYREARRQ